MAPSDSIRRIFLVADTWNEINGVAKTLKATTRELLARGREVFTCIPSRFYTLPNPVYPELRLSVASPWKVGAMLEKFAPDAVHIATEGPLGLSARIYCGMKGIPFTTAFHTRWDTFLEKMVWLPTAFTWTSLRWFHGASSAVLAPTLSIIAKLEAEGITRARLWKRGIEQTLFRPRPKTHAVKRPILLNVGRVSVEKNIEAFLRMTTEGTKYVVGDGPLLNDLRRAYARNVAEGSIVFFGEKRGEELAELYSEADMFVFPSRNDTFGNVNLEAMASGLGVIAYPEPGARDLVIDPRLGALDEDLDKAAARAFETVDSDYCVTYARTFTWEQATDTFLGCLAKIS